MNSFYILVMPSICLESESIECLSNSQLFTSMVCQDHYHFEYNHYDIRAIFDIYPVNCNNTLGTFFYQSSLYQVQSIPELITSDSFIVLWDALPSTSSLSYSISDVYNTNVIHRLNNIFILLNLPTLSGLYEFYLQVVEESTQTILQSTTFFVRNTESHPQVAFYEIDEYSYLIRPSVLLNDQKTQPGFLEPQFLQAGSLCYYPIHFTSSEDYFFLDIEGLLSNEFSFIFYTNYGIKTFPITITLNTYSPSYFFHYTNLFDEYYEDASILYFKATDSITVRNVRPVFYAMDSIQSFQQVEAIYSLNYEQTQYEIHSISYPQSTDFVPFDYVYWKQTYTFDSYNQTHILYTPPRSLVYYNLLPIVRNVPVHLCPIEKKGYIFDYSVSPPFPPTVVIDEHGCISGTFNETFTQQIYVISGYNDQGSVSYTTTILLSSYDCEEEDEWTQVSVGEYSIKECNDLRHYEGNYKRYCSLYLRDMNQYITQINNTVIALYDPDQLQAVWSEPIDECVLRMPSNVQYPTPMVLHLGEHATYAPTYDGNADYWEISPSLPPDLSFDSSLGIISGSCNEYHYQEHFTITVYGPQDRLRYETTEIILTCFTSSCPPVDEWEETQVGYAAESDCLHPYQHGKRRRSCILNENNEVKWEETIQECPLRPPWNFHYPQTTYYLYKRTTLPSITPSWEGIAQYFTITPPLPGSLSLVQTTGSITGILDTNSPMTTYNITAHNVDSSTTIQINLSIQVLSCPAEYPWVETEHSNTLIIDCLDPYNYEGTIERTCEYKNITVPSAQWTKSINHCVMKPPVIYDYGENFIVTFYKGLSQVSHFPSYSGIVTSWTIDPTPISGLVFSQTTGILFGSINARIDPLYYNITATNEQASVSHMVRVQVVIEYCEQDGLWPRTEKGESATLACPSNAYHGIQTRKCNSNHPPTWETIINNCILNIPSNLYYNKEEYVAKKDYYFATDRPQYDGIITKFSVFPELFPGLSIDPETGVISGTPKDVHIPQMFSITGENAEGISEPTEITLSITSVMCEEDGIWPATEISTISYLYCGKGFSGVQYRRCYEQRDDYYLSEGVWGDVNSAGCVLVNENEIPEEGRVFIYGVITVCFSIHQS